MSERCDRYRTACSAVLDGEDPGLDVAELRRHLEVCAGCRTFARRAERLHRAVRLRAAEPVPDLTAAILARAPVTPPRPAPATAPVATLRWLLALMGLLQLGASLPTLLLGEDGGMQSHAARHLGSFGAAIGVGFLVAAWRPGRVVGLLPVVVALGLLLVATALVDLAMGRAEAVGEVHHVSELVGVLLTWALARTTAGGRRIALA